MKINKDDKIQKYTNFKDHKCVFFSYLELFNIILTIS